MTEILVDDRLMSGTGLLRIPVDTEKVYYWSVVIDVIRPPSVVFKSNRYSPPRQRYATVTFLRDGYVLEEYAIDYEQRRFDLVLDPSAQTLLAVKCAYQGTLQSFVNLATALGLPVISVTDLVKPMESLNLVPDSMQFRMEIDTALQVRLFYRELLTCNDDSVKQPRQPPPPPPRDSVPPGVPIDDISPPYDEDDTITQPDPLDNDDPVDPPFDLPFGETCERYLVIGAITSSVTGREERRDEFYGVIENFFFNPSSSSGDGRDSIIIESRGLAVFNGQIQPCGSTVEQVFLQVPAEEYVSHELISITPAE